MLFWFSVSSGGEKLSAHRFSLMFSARVLSSESYDKMHHVCEPCEIQQHTLMLLAVVRNSLQTVTFFAAGMKVNAQQQSNTVGDNMKSSCLEHPAFMTLLVNATA